MMNSVLDRDVWRSGSQSSPSVWGCCELAELAGQHNAIDGRIVEIVAELDRDGLWGVTGARSVAGLRVAWKMGCSSGERPHDRR